MINATAAQQNILMHIMGVRDAHHKCAYKIVAEGLSELYLGDPQPVFDHLEAIRANVARVLSEIEDECHDQIILDACRAVRAHTLASPTYWRLVHIISKEMHRI